MTARLPTPGSDSGSWGDVLNTYLSVEHNGDGTLKFRTQTKTVAPTLNDASAASANLAAIQAALNTGGTVNLVGTGVAYVSDTMVIGSNTRLITDKGLTLRQAPGTKTNGLVGAAMIKSSAWVSAREGANDPTKRTQVSLAVGGTGNKTLTVTYPTPHGLSVGQPFVLQGSPGLNAIDNLYSDLFIVKTVQDTYTITTNLTVTPAGVPGTNPAYAAKSGFTPVTLTWTQGLSVAVNWPSHGFSIEQPIWIQPPRSIYSRLISVPIDPAHQGSGYAVGDSITLSGGTGTQNAILVVDTVGAGGSVTSAHVYQSQPGSYTTGTTGFQLSQGATSGAGTGIQFTAAPVLAATPAIDSAFAGVFRIVRIIDANNFEIAINRVPVSGASCAVPLNNEPILAIAADQNITIEGGTWDYDFWNNGLTFASPSVPAGATGQTNPLWLSFNSTFIAYLAGIYNLTVRDIIGMNAPWRIFSTMALNHATFENIGSVRGTSTFSGDPIVNMQGPIFDARVDQVWGWTQDDAVALQPAIWDAYGRGADGSAALYGGGDILDATVSRVDVWYNKNSGGAGYGGSAVSVYPWVGTYMDNIVIEKSHGAYITNAPFQILCSQADSSAVIGKLTYRDISWSGLAGYSGMTAGGVSCFSFNTPATIEHLTIDGFTMPNIVSAYTVAPISVGVGSLGLFTLRNCKFKFGSLASQYGVYLVGGTFYEIVMDNCRADGISGTGDVIALTGTCNVNTINIQNSYLNSVQAAFVSAAGVAKTLVVLRNNVLYSSAGIYVQSDTSIQAYGNRHTGNTLGFIRIGGVSPNIDITAHGNLSDNTQYVDASSSGALTTVNSLDFQVDVTKLKRASGQMAYNTNTAAGTLGVAGLITCQGTATNSWKLLADNTKTY